MKKVLRALSIGAMALQGAALLVFLLTVALQRQLMSLMSYSPEMLSYFIFPGVQTVYLLLVTAVIVAIGVSTLAQGRSIWAEIVGIVMLAVVACGMSIAEKKLAPRA